MTAINPCPAVKKTPAKKPKGILKPPPIVRQNAMRYDVTVPPPPSPIPFDPDELFAELGSLSVSE